MMGGDVTVESDSGKGSTFTIRLPLAGRERSQRTSSRTKPRRLHASGRAGTVLVIDDDPAARDLMKRFLTREGFQRWSPRAARRAAAGARAPPDRDHAGRDDAEDGRLGGAAALKADPQLRDIPVIMVTIVDDQEPRATRWARRST